MLSCKYCHKVCMYLFRLQCHIILSFVVEIKVNVISFAQINL